MQNRNEGKSIRAVRGEAADCVEPAFAATRICALDSVSSHRSMSKNNDRSLYNNRNLNFVQNRFRVQTFQSARTHFKENDENENDENESRKGLLFCEFSETTAHKSITRFATPRFPSSLDSCPMAPVRVFLPVSIRSPVPSRQASSAWAQYVNRKWPPSLGLAIGEKFCQFSGLETPCSVIRNFAIIKTL